MPYVLVKVVGSMSLYQRGEIAKGISSVLEEVAQKPPSVTYIQFDEANVNRWGRGETMRAFDELGVPVVEVKAAGQLTFAQKEQIVAGIHGVLEPFVRASNPPSYIVIEEISRQSWSRGGTMLESP